MQSLKRVADRLHLLLMMLLVLASALFISHADAAVRTAAAPGEVRLPIIMYHSVLKNKAKAGKYIVTPEVLEADLKYLKERGYETVSARQLIEYCEGGGELPEKPVLLTFDDGFYNNYTYALPLLEKYDMCAVISIVGRYTNRSSERGEEPSNNYSCLGWEELSLLLASSRFEIGNHTNNMHDPDTRLGVVRADTESEEEFASSIISDLSALQDQIREELRIGCQVFTYPFGKYSELSEETVESLGFKLTLTCYEKINVIRRGHSEDLYLLGRYNRDYGVSTGAFMGKLKIE